MFEDKTLVCKDCGKEFVWTAGEQEFYASRGFENQPQRCKACRDARKNAVRGERQMFVWNRTTDTRIFSPLLYQLSYEAINLNNLQKNGDPERARTVDL